MSYPSKYKGVMSSNYSGVYGAGGGCRWVVNYTGIEHIDLGTIPILDDLTVELFIRTNQSTAATLISAHNADVADFLTIDLLPIGSNQSVIKVNATTAMAGQGTTVVNDNQWHRVVVTIDSTSGATQVFIDSITDYSTTHTNIPSITNSKQILVGASQDADANPIGNKYIGRISSLSFKYGTTLSYSYPMNDGWENNPIVVETVSSNNGILINGSESSWATDCELNISATLNHYSTSYGKEYS